MLSKAAVAGKLRGIGSRLETAKAGIPDWQWRTGIAPHAVGVAQAARRACGAWAWMLRRGFNDGEYAGWAHVLEPLPLPHKPGKRPKPGKTIGRREATPWGRLNEFARWVSTLPGVKGMPGANVGELWLWALRTAADWLDAQEPATAAYAFRRGHRGYPMCWLSRQAAAAPSPSGPVAATSPKQPAAYTVGSVLEMAGVSDTTLNNYAKLANVNTPKRGGRNHCYTADEVRAILKTAIGTTSDGATKDKCRKALERL